FLQSPLPVLFVVGTTGCGKTTRVPLYTFLHRPEEARILVLQPRRLAVRECCSQIAKDLAVVRGVPVESIFGRTVGYRIADESKWSAGETKICLTTTAFFLEEFQQQLLLFPYTHLLIDEVHESSEDLELVLLCVKTLRIQIPTLRVVLLSATMEAGLLWKYFASNDDHVMVEKLRTIPTTECIVVSRSNTSQVVHNVTTLYLNSVQSFPKAVRPTVVEYLQTVKQWATEAKLTHRQEKMKQKEQLRENLYVGPELPRDTNFRSHMRDLQPAPNNERNWEDVLAGQLSATRSRLADLVVGICLAELTKKTLPSGNVLVFLPGLAQIRDVNAELQRRLQLHSIAVPSLLSTRVFTLHSDLHVDREWSQDFLIQHLRVRTEEE
ncbi:unnamed protein product, partial [Amoebophrya sp. A120]